MVRISIMDKLINKIAGWQKKKYTRMQKILFTVIYTFFNSVLFAGPAFLLSEKMDEIFALPDILPPPFNVYLGTLIFIPGMALFIWVPWIFFKVGEGTPGPFIPTQKLVTDGPFAYCRNPGVLGAIIWISGSGVILNSFSFIVIGLIIPVLYLPFIKLIEEKELEARFGQTYIEYKRRTPFLIPAFRRNAYRLQGRTRKAGMRASARLHEDS